MSAAATIPLRAALVAGGWCDLVAVQLAGSGTPLWVWVTGTALGAAAAAWPDTLATLLFLVLLLAAWLGVPADPVSRWVLLGAAGILGTHTAAVLLSQGAPRMAPPGRLVGRWTRRAAGAWLVAAAFWAVARLSPSPDGATATVLTIAALLVVAAGAVWLGGRLGTGDRRP